MRCYFATPRYDADGTTALGYQAGIRNVLVSYANVDEPRNGFRFWLARTNERTNERTNLTP